MTKVTLQEYLKTKTQLEAAEAIGVTQGAICQMVNSGRRIEITIHEGGRVEANEIRPVGRKRVAKAA